MSIKGLEIRRRDVARINDAAAKITSVTGTVVVAGVGEGQVEISFPATFVEPPNISFGAELYPNFSVTSGFYPKVNACIIGWETVEPDGIDQGRKFYVGATLSIVSEGEGTQKVYLHWRVEGSAVRNPVSRTTDLTTDDTI